MGCVNHSQDSLGYEEYDPSGRLLGPGFSTPKLSAVRRLSALLKKAFEILTFVAKRRGNSQKFRLRISFKIVFNSRSHAARRPKVHIKVGARCFELANRFGKISEIPRYVPQMFRRRLVQELSQFCCDDWNLGRRETHSAEDRL